jgi:hypothetical protein
MNTATKAPIELTGAAFGAVAGANPAAGPNSALASCGGVGLAGPEPGNPRHNRSLHAAPSAGASGSDISDSTEVNCTWVSAAGAAVAPCVEANQKLAPAMAKPAVTEERTNTAMMVQSFRINLRLKAHGWVGL